jgi:membrane-bound lytic murein transglycosylase MltF
MPGTYAVIKNRKPEMGAIEDPESNIAAGIMHSRGLWNTWKDHGSTEERLRFMFGSYNAGEGTIKRAKSVARAEQLDDRSWSNIETVAPKVQRWRYRETLPYVRKIEQNHEKLLQQGKRPRLVKDVQEGDRAGSADKASRPESAGKEEKPGRSGRAGREDRTKAAGDSAKPKVKSERDP